MNDVQGKVALVTGAGSGIGRATALAFGARGASVAVADFNPEGAQETVKQLEAAGAKGLAVEVDVGDAASVEVMVKAITDGLGRLDYLLDAAGISAAGAVPRGRPRCLRAGAARQRHRHVPGAEARDPRDARRRWRRVRVDSIGPGVIKTGMTAPIFAEETTGWLLGITPMRRVGEPNEVAELVVLLCSDAASYMTAGYYPVDGGWLAG